MVKVKINMTGWIMKEHGVPNSRLTVIEQVEDYIEPNGLHNARWLCRCECGNKCTVKGIYLRSGITLSCGCYHIEKIKERFKKYNNYSEKLSDEYGEYYIGYCSNTESEFYIDADDYDKVKDYCWAESIYKGFSRITTHIGNKTIKMHQFIGYAGYDHEDRNELNNRKYNLRLCTHQENDRNHKIRIDNTSGVTGVSFKKDINKWRAYIMINQKQIELGYFENKEDAIKARLRAEKEYFGEFASQKHLYEQYGI